MRLSSVAVVKKWVRSNHVSDEVLVNNITTHSIPLILYRSVKPLRVNLTIGADIELNPIVSRESDRFHGVQRLLHRSDPGRCAAQYASVASRSRFCAKKSNVLVVFMVRQI